MGPYKNGENAPQNNGMELSEYHTYKVVTPNFTERIEVCDFSNVLFTYRNSLKSRPKYQAFPSVIVTRTKNPKRYKLKDFSTS